MSNRILAPENAQFLRILLANFPRVKIDSPIGRCYNNVVYVYVFNNMRNGVTGMAGELRIKAGTKLRMALDVPIGQTPDFGLVCTFVKSLDTASFLISIPMQEGKALPLDEEQKLLICFGSGADMQIVAGYADDVVKEGIRRCWKIRRVSEQRQFFRRSDERLRATIPIQYTQPTWPANEDGVIPPEEGMTLDISAGGLACYLNRGMNVGEVCEMTLPTIGTTREGHEIRGAVAVICWTREAPKGSPFRRVAGFQFRFADSVERQQMQDYVNTIKKRYKL